MMYARTSQAIDAAVQRTTFPCYIRPSAYRDGTWIITERRPTRGSFIAVTGPSLSHVHLIPRRKAEQ